MKKAMLFLAVFSLVSLALAADDPFVGTWKEDVSKAKVTPSRVSPSSYTLIIVPEGNAFFKITAHIATADGKTRSIEWSGTLDGKDYPVKGLSETETYSLKKIDSNTLVRVGKKAGKELANWRMVVSKDGRMLTSTGKFRDEKGQEINMTQIFEKQ